MKVAHFAQFTPNRSGMYETVRDLIFAERMFGIDAQFIDCKGNEEQGQDCSRVGLYEGNLVSVSPEWSYDADILVRHSLAPEPIMRIGIPVVMCLHGRPEYSYVLEHAKKSPVLSIMTKGEANPQYKAFISFWKEHKQVWDIIVPGKKTYYVPAIVDLDKYNPEGKKFNFGDFSGKPNIVVADIWREDITPFNVIFAVARFKEVHCPSAKLHVFGTPPPGAPFISELMLRLRNKGIVGIADCLVPFMPDVYRATDIVVTPHNIATRVIRETLASGVPIVAGSDCSYTKYTADARDYKAFSYQINRCWVDLQSNKEKLKKDARNIAEKEFNYDNTGKAMFNVFNEVLGESSKEVTYKTPIEWNGWTLDPADWIILRDLILKMGIKKVVEIGAGASTQLFERLDITVISYEAKPTTIQEVLRKTQHADIRLWNGHYLQLKDEGFELALIDGPFGGKNREPSYKAIEESCIPIVACHDYKRKEDKKWIDKYFSNWEEIARCDESIQGLLILRRPA